MAEDGSWQVTQAAPDAEQFHTDLVVLGFTGSYGRVAAFARQWRVDRQREQQTTGRGTFVPLAFRPGEAFQFDWSEDHAVLGGERVKLQVAHIKLAHSRAFLLRAYLLQTHEMLFDAHWHGFRVFGGVPGRGIYDNMKTGVDRVGCGKERQVNIRFLAITSHYVFEPGFCKPASGWEKGQVEKRKCADDIEVWRLSQHTAKICRLEVESATQAVGVELRKVFRGASKIVAIKAEDWSAHGVFSVISCCLRCSSMRRKCSMFSSAP